MAIRTTHAIERFLLHGSIRQRLQAATRRHHRSCLMTLARWLAGQKDVIYIEEVASDHLRAFISAMQDRQADAINSRMPAAADGFTPKLSTSPFYVRAIQVFFRWLVEEELIPQHPALHLAEPASQQHIVKTLHPQHLEALFGACDCTTSLGLRDYMLMLLLLDTGLRVRELCGLTLDQIYEDHLRVVGSKEGKEREVAFCPATGSLIWKYVNQHRVAADPSVRTLLTDCAGRPLDPPGVGKLLRRVRDAAGLGNVPVTARLFRHMAVRARLEQSRSGEV